MASGRELRFGITGNIFGNYTRTDQVLNPSELKDILQYTGAQGVMENGVEDSQVDLLYYAQRTYTPSSVESINLETDLLNKWGDTLDFYYAKCIIIKNLTAIETVPPNGYLTVNYLDETMYIGPRGKRIIWERKGIRSAAGQTPGIAGILTLQSSSLIEYDLIIAGSSLLTNPSSVVSSGA